MNAPSLQSGPSLVPIDGDGALAVEITVGTSSPVLAVHGLSSQRKLWNWLRADSPDLTLVMPDLRGRGGSMGVTGPSSISRHADDLVAVLDRLGLDRISVLGMSMGGFVAANLASRYPDRVSSLVLVDGGFPMPPPPGVSPESLPTVFGARLDRLSRRWASLEEYRTFFVPSTSPLLDPNDPLLTDYLQHDLVDGTVQLSAADVLSDAEDVFFGPGWIDRVRVPIHFLHAEWSFGPASPPGYPEDAVDRFRHRAESVVYLPGIDHAGTVMTPAGAAAVASLVRTVAA